MDDCETELIHCQTECSDASIFFSELKDSSVMGEGLQTRGVCVLFSR